MKVHLIDSYGNYIKTIIKEHQRFYTEDFIEDGVVYRYLYSLGSIFAIAKVYA